ncbi:MAG: hypothetical protein WD738_20110 [Pirellulales bacterium]
MLSERSHPLLRVIALAQGLYFLATGIWPFVSLHTFLAVTGPKADIWLVKTVAALVTAVGLVLLVAQARRPVSDEIVLLGIGTAAGLAGIDVTYVSVGRIPPIYLVDAAIEGLIVVAWLAAWWLGRR